MKQPVRRLQWTAVWLLQIPLYLLTSYIVRALIGSSYRLLIRAGANLPPNFVLQHFLWVSLISGFFAGLIGLRILRATLLILPKHVPSPIIAPWKRPQAWTWVLPSMLLTYAVSAWFADHARYSVLGWVGTTSPDVVATFFGDGCHLAGSTVGMSIIIYCMPQITFTHPWIGTIGYSSASFVPSKWLRFPKLRSTTEVSAEPEHQTKAVS